MNKNTLIAVLGLAVVVLLVLWLKVPPPPPPPPVNPDSITNIPTATEGVSVTNEPGRTVETERPVVSVTNEKSSVKEEDVRRLADCPQRVTAIVDIKGQGQYSKICYKSSGNFHYIHSLVATSFVTNRETYPTGMVKVEELRSFDKARETIDLDDVDVALSFERVPLGDIKEWATIVCRAAGIATQAGIQSENLYLAAGGAMAGAAAEATRILAGTMEQLDGESLNGFFRSRGIPMPRWIQKLVTHVAEKEAMKRLESVRGHIQRLEKTSYRFSYYQSSAGAPMLVTYSRTDGQPLTEEERAVLDSVNVFLDSKVLPDRNTSIGEEWTVAAKDIEQIVGTATGGRVDGEVTLKRTENNPENGNWRIEVVPKPIYVLNEKGIPSGAISVEFGGGETDPDGQIVRGFQFVGRGRLDVETTRRFLFVRCITRSVGECIYRSTLATEPMSTPRKD